MKHTRYFGLLAAGALFAAAPANPAAAGGLPVVEHDYLLDGILVVVNNSVITYLQRQDRIAPNMKRLAEMLGNTTNFVQKAKALQDDELDFLIKNRLILDDFGRGEYTTNWIDDAVEEAIKQDIKTAYGGDRARLRRTLQAEGRTYESYVKELRESIIITQLGRLHTGSGKIVISPTAIEKYYNEHPDDFKVEDQIKLRMIQLPESSDSPPGAAKQLGGEILQRIDSGVPFADMAKVYSSGFTRASGGDYGWVDRKEILKELTETAFSLKPGQHSPVMELPDQQHPGRTVCYLLMVEDVRPGPRQSLVRS